MRAHPLTVGGALVFAEQLQIQRIILGAKGIDVCIVGEKMLEFVNRHRNRDCCLYWPTPEECLAAPGILVFSVMKGFERVCICTSMENLADYIENNENIGVVWPRKDAGGLRKHVYGSTLSIQSFYSECGYVPRLGCIQDVIYRAVEFTGEYAGSRMMPIAVHMKNVDQISGCSNANVDAWHDFFVGCLGLGDVVFFLIGNDPVDARIKKLSNVVITKDHGGYLPLDLALIQTSAMFMGMSSGPCNMAIFGENPYVIFKNPEHDTAEMDVEIGEAKAFLFAEQNQRFLRVAETKKVLLNEFEQINVPHVKHLWKERFKKMQNSTAKDQEKLCSE